MIAPKMIHIALKRTAGRVVPPAPMCSIHPATGTKPNVPANPTARPESQINCLIGLNAAPRRMRALPATYETMMTRRMSRPSSDDRLTWEAIAAYRSLIHADVACDACCDQRHAPERLRRQAGDDLRPVAGAENSRVQEVSDVHEIDACKQPQEVRSGRELPAVREEPERHAARDDVGDHSRGRDDAARTGRTNATVEIEISGSSNDVPGGVGIVDVHRPCHRVGGGAEILLANESIVIDNERHDPCRVILSRPGDEREAAG